MLASVIFDFDGIIVNTEPLHYMAFQEVLSPMGLGYSWQDYVGLYIGYDDRDAFREVFRRANRLMENNELTMLISKKAEAFQQAIASGVESYPGVVELVISLSGQIPIALCSGALRSDIVPILRQLGIENAFAVMVTADEVSASKPDPESYSLTVSRLTAKFPDLTINPTVCLAIEDTPAGIRSAKGAGLKVLAVTNSYAEDKLKDASVIVDSLLGVDLHCLARLFC